MDGGGAAAAAAAAAVRAIKASGVVVSVAPDEFQTLLNRNAGGMVVHAPGGLFSSGHRYLMGYMGLAFCTKAKEPLALPRGCQVVEAKKIWVPG